jgi:hypothetical protein
MIQNAIVSAWSISMAILAALSLARAGASDRAPFMEDHCFDCHDSSEQKGKLRLDNLKFDPSDAANAKTWIHVLERVEANEMPPKKKERPPDAERVRFVQSLERDLMPAETARQKAEGRVALRRLNRTEYQNTLHDLLGIETDVKSLLPEDTTALGFDNIGEALHISSVLLERYLDAADVALDEIFVHGARPETKKWHVSLVPQKLRTDLPPGQRDYRLSHIQILPDDTVVFVSAGIYQPVTLEQFRAPVAGRYRIRISSYARNSLGKPITFAWYCGSFDSKNTHLAALFDAPPEKPAIFELDEYLPLRGTMKPILFGIGEHNAKAGEEYGGPGVAFPWVEIEGPILDTWPPIGRQRLLGDVDLKAGTLADADKALRWLATRAFRRAITDADVEPYLALTESALDARKPFEDALRAGIKGVLCSPDFLFFKESPAALDSFALASRLSYFLWSSPPDDALVRAALNGEIRKPAVLRAEVERMLNDPKAARFTENFTGQWLGLRNIEFTTPDKKLYPEHDDPLQDAMLRETRLFFDELLKQDLSVANFVDSDFTMLNERLARHYGIGGVVGQQFRRVALKPEDHRGGVLTQAAILKITANGTNTSPVIRGNWVLKNIIGRPVKPPPPNVPAIEPDIRGAKTIREQIAKHRELESCAVCHDRMDPLGLALENYDVIGGWRTNYRSVGQGQSVKTEVDGRRVQYKIGPAVDPSGVLPDGRAFPDLDALKKLLLQDKPQIARCVAEKLLTYATGAGITFADRPAVEAIVQQAAKKDYGLRTLVHAVVESPAFLAK